MSVVPTTTAAEPAAGPSREVDGLPGRAGDVARLFGERVRIVDFYDGQGSAIYHQLTHDDRSEVAELVRLVRRCEGAVLELACGSGRLTLPLLTCGHEVVAIDNSPRMLELLAQRLATHAGARVASRLTSAEADITRLALGRQFGAVVLGTTSISLLDAGQRRALFERVREHLDADGRFFVSTLEISAADTLHPAESAEVFLTQQSTLGAAAFNDIPDAMCTLFEYVDWQRERRWVSVLCQPALGDPLLATTSTHLIATPELEAELLRCGLAVVERHEVAGIAAIGSLARRVVLLETRLAGVAAGSVGESQ